MYEMYINGTIAPYNEQAEPGVTRQSCVFRAWSRVPSEDGIIEKILRRRETRLLCSPSLLLLYKRRIFRARERVGRRYAAAAYRRINQNYYEAISAAATAREDKKAATPFDDQSFFKVHCFALDYYYYWEILDRGTRRNFGFREYQVRRTVGKHVYRVVTDELSLSLPPLSPGFKSRA